MQTVFRVKRRLDEKQLSGLKIAKRQRLDSDVPVVLTFAGTTPGNDPETALCVIRNHQESDRSTTAEKADLKERGNEEIASAENFSAEPSKETPSATEIDQLFRIYDAYQEKITNPVESTRKAVSEMGADEPIEANSEFVYDIYYLREDRTPGGDAMLIDFDEDKFRLEQCSPANDELVNEGEEEKDAFEDDDSNAEDNPHNDYPDEEDWYADNGVEIPPPLDDDDYYGYEGYDNMTSLERQMYEMNFFGSED